MKKIYLLTLNIFNLVTNKDYTSNDRKGYITASGGPFLRLPKKFLKNIFKKNLNTNWSMGKKFQ